MTASRAWLPPILVAAAVTLLIAALGATITDLGPWYRSLRQPSWTPPDALYGLAWTLIYSLNAIAAVSAWRQASSARAADQLVRLFALNGFLNLAWSLLFFRAHRPDWALIEVVALWVSIVALIVATARFSRAAAMLLLPYLAWVTFAAALNIAIVQLNAPFA